MSVVVKNLSADFGDSIRPHVFKQEVNDDVIITTNLSSVSTDSGNVNLSFDSALSEAEETQLDILIAAHDGAATDPIVTIKSMGSSNTSATIVSNQTGNRTITLPDADDTLVGETVTQTLTNKKLNASNTTVVDSGDNTKIINFDTSGATSSCALTLSGLQTGNRVITFPDATDTLACLTTTQTMSNKKLLDSSVSFIDQADSTKEFYISLGGATTSTNTTLISSQTGNRSITLPDANTTLVGEGITQTLTNKILDSTTNTISADKLHSLTTTINISSAAAPTIDQVLRATSSTAATWQTLDTFDNLKLETNTLSSLSGDINIIPNGSSEVKVKANPISSLGVATKSYVDATAGGLVVKNSVRVKTAAALPAYTQAGAGAGATLTADANGAIGTIDGITLVANDRILVDSLGSAADPDNGIYDLTQVGDGSNPWVLTRSTDADTELVAGNFIIVEEGTTYASAGMVLTAEGTITVDTTDITFSQLNSPLEVTSSNIGTGVGVFKQKISNDFEFKKLNAGSNKVTLTSNTDDISVDLNEANIVIGNLSGAPSGSIVGTSDTQTLSNKTLVDSSTTFVDNIDTSKKVRFQVSGVSSATTRVLTIPDSDSTIVGTIATQTLTNKTITDGSNSVRASELATTGSSVLLTEAPPSSGQVLTAKSPTVAFWDTPSNGNVLGVNSALDLELAVFDGTGGKNIKGSGIRHYGASATDPTSPTPQAGDKYYNTAINHEMCYDGTRSKWLSVAVLMDGAGINGNVSQNNFYRRWNGMPLSITRGPYVAKGTIIRIGYATSNAVSHTYQVLVGGVVVAELASGGAASAFDDTLNADFEAGIMSSRNKSGSATASYLQSTIYYKLRA